MTVSALDFTDQCFIPHAIYTHDNLVVFVRGCHYRSQPINRYFDLYIEAVRPWHAPWERCIGFSLFYPNLPASGEVKVSAILDQFEQDNPGIFKLYLPMLLKAVGDLNVVLP